MRDAAIAARYAEDYEKTARTSASEELSFVAKEIADALRRCERAILGEAITATPEGQMRAFIEKQPTRRDLSDKTMDL